MASTRNATGTSEAAFGIGEAGAGRLLLKNEGAGQLGLRNDGDTAYTNLRVAQIITGDHVFDDTTCAICGVRFAVGDDIVLRVIAVDPDPVKDGTLTRCVPVHPSCRLR